MGGRLILLLNLFPEFFQRSELDDPDVSFALVGDLGDLPIGEILEKFKLQDFSIDGFEV